MAVIYDPSRIEVATSASIGKSGQYLTDISKKNNALVAINGGGFIDDNFQGNGATPVGVTISKGKGISASSSTYGIIVVGAKLREQLLVKEQMELFCF